PTHTSRTSPPLPYTTLFRSVVIQRLSGVLQVLHGALVVQPHVRDSPPLTVAGLRAHASLGLGPVHAALSHQTVETSRGGCPDDQDRKSTRLNSSHVSVSYAV